MTAGIESTEIIDKVETIVKEAGKPKVERLEILAGMPTKEQLLEAKTNKSTLTLEMMADQSLEGDVFDLAYVTQNPVAQIIVLNEHYFGNIMIINYKVEKVYE